MRVLLILILCLNLLACGGPNTSKIPKEIPANFTRNYADTQLKTANVPMLPGKAALPAAPIQGANTQNSQQEVQPLLPPTAPGTSPEPALPPVSQ